MNLNLRKKWDYIEFLNVITELFWTLKSLKQSYIYISPHPPYYYNPYKFSFIFIGIFLHTPCSITLHSLRIFRLAPPNCFWAKLDQNSIIMNCILYQFSTYNNLLIPIFIVAIFIPYLLISSNSTSKERTLNIGYLTVIYLFPIINILENKGILYLIVGSLFHIKNKELFGLGNSIFHIFIAYYHKYLFDAIIMRNS